MMTPSQSASWQQIQAYRFPSTDAALSFAARLARENRWSWPFAQQVVEEYQRFCFLALHAGHPVTPSDQIDQAWHLHMLYSQDYWEDFCPQILGRNLHHGPTRGGQDEQSKFADWYQRTLESYQRFFGQPPPTVWPAPRERFEDADQFVRVNRSDTLMLDRKQVRQVGVSAVPLIAVSLGMGSAMAAAEDLLAGFGILVLLAVAIGLIAAVVMVANKKRDQASGSGCGGVGGGSSKSADDGGGSGGDGGSGCGGGCGGCGG